MEWVTSCHLTLVLKALEGHLSNISIELLPEFANLFIGFSFP